MYNSPLIRGQREKWQFFRAAQLWPRTVKFDPDGWLENFSEDEIPFALRLLESFTYYSDELVQHLFRTAFQNISQLVVRNKDNYFAALTQWSQFIDSAIVVRVEGGHASDADSGYIFTRYAREVLGFDEDKILSPARALQRLRDHPRGNVIFVDDFVGSGEQFADLWSKIYTLDAEARGSFKSLVTLSSTTEIGFYYCPLITTEKGRAHIADVCPDVKVVSAHILPETYSALSDSSVIWREDMRVDGPAFIKRVSDRAGIPDRDGGEGCWRGYRKLGLALAFAHGWPDSILPIFTLDSPRWKPLVKKGI